MNMVDGIPAFYLDDTDYDFGDTEEGRSERAFQEAVRAQQEGDSYQSDDPFYQNTFGRSNTRGNDGSGESELEKQQQEFNKLQSEFDKYKSGEEEEIKQPMKKTSRVSKKKTVACRRYKATKMILKICVIRLILGRLDMTWVNTRMRLID